MDRSEDVLSFLQDAGVGYQLFHHKPGITIEEFLSGMDLDFTKTTLCKNVFLCNRQGTRHYLVLLAPHRSYRTAVVSKLLGTSRLSFAPAEDLPEYLGCTSGAVSPLGLMFDPRQRVMLAIDEALLTLPSLLFHPCVSDRTVQVSTADFLGRFLPACGHGYTPLHLTDE